MDLGSSLGNLCFLCPLRGKVQRTKNRQKLSYYKFLKDEEKYKYEIKKKMQWRMSGCPEGKQYPQCKINGEINAK